MRIAIDCRSVYPGKGGIGQYAEKLAAHLPRLAPEHEYVLIRSAREGIAPIVRAANVRELVFPAAMIDERWEQFQLPSILADEQIDLYHGTCFSLPAVKTTRW